MRLPPFAGPYDRHRGRLADLFKHRENFSNANCRPLEGRLMLDRPYGCETSAVSPAS